MTEATQSPDMEPMTPPHARWGAAHLLAWGGLWLLPMVLCALPKTFPSFPSNHLRVFYRLSSLFPNRSKAWSNCYVQGRAAVGAAWVSLNAADYDPLVIYGYENRLQRMIAESANYGQRGERLRQRMAEFVAAKHAKIYPDAAPLREVRFVRATWTVGESGTMTHPTGRWRVLPLDLVPAKQQRVLSSHPIGGGTAPPERSSVVAAAPAAPAGLTDAGLKAALAAGRTAINADSASRVTAQGLRLLWEAKTVTNLSLAGRKLTKEEMSGLGGMTQLNVLNLSGSVFPVEGIESLLKLGELRVVILRDSKWRGRDLARLTALPKIERCDASGTPEAFHLLMHAGKWSLLEELRLRGVKGMSPVLAAMPAHPTLRKLDLSGTDLKSADVGKLARHPKLALLWLDQTQVDDEVIPNLAAMPQLAQVSLEKSKVTQAGFLQIAGLKHLQLLRAEGQRRKLANETAETGSTQTSVAEPVGKDQGKGVPPAAGKGTSVPEKVGGKAGSETDGQRPSKGNGGSAASIPPTSK